MVNTVVANTVSNNPWAVFNFDGIFGLGLESLSITKEFHWFHALYASGELQHNLFGLFFSETGEGSEMALGGVNYDLFESPLHWVNVARPEQGHWQVEVLGFHVGNLTLDICRNGGCRGVIDSGTSHIAIPSPHDQDVVNVLSEFAGDRLDCRFSGSNLPIVIELKGFNLTLHAEDYMRQLPLPSDLHVGAQPALVTPRNDSTQGPQVCRPRIVGVDMPPHIGGSTFILGQPVLHRYYTVYSYDGPQLAFGLAAARMSESYV